MKKLLVGLMAVGSLLAATAQDNQNIDKRDLLIQDARLSKMTLKRLAKPGESVLPATRAGEDQTLVFGYCAGINGYVGGPNLVGYSIEQAIEIPEELAQQWIGNQVTGMQIGFGVSTNRRVFAYVTTDLKGVPEVSKNATMTKQQDWNTVTFDTPYTIDGTTFYVGYQIAMDNAEDYPMVVDGDTEYYSPYGDWMGLDNEWFQMGEANGNNCIKALITGTNDLPQNKAKIGDVYVPSIVGIDKPFISGFLVQNEGVQPITSVTYSVSLNGETVVENETADLSNPIESGSFQWVEVYDLVCPEVGNDIPVIYTLNKVNNTEDESPDDNSRTGYLTCSSLVFQQNALVEEFTGTWCGNCPRGIVGMAYMKENFADKGFIGVAAHTSDEMQSNSYYDVAYYYSQGTFPSAVMNRLVYFDPGMDTLENYFNILTQDPSFAEIKVTASYSEEKDAVIINSTTTFGLDFENSPYQLSFGIAEDEVGPYFQKNDYSGATGTLPGWDNKGPYVAWVFNEVGRIVVNPAGIPNSLPTQIKTGEEYTYQLEIPMSHKGDNTDSLDYWICDKLTNCYVVGMIVDTSTEEYTILNSGIAEEIENALAGVETIEDNFDGTYRVYNPQGMKVLDTKDASLLNSLPHGIYIVNGKKVAL